MPEEIQIFVRKPHFRGRIRTLMTQLLFIYFQCYLLYQSLTSRARARSNYSILLDLKL